MGHHPEAALVSYLRQVATWLVYRHGGLVMHSATLISRQHALIFYGHSGAGKTTLCQHAPSRTPILTDDLTGLIKTRGKWRAWGMPTLTHAHWIKQTQGIRVKALFRLIKATVTRIDPISSARAAAQAACFPHVLGNTRPWTEPLLDRLADLAQSVRCFDLHFEKTGAYWDLVSKRIDFQPIQ